ncbi:Rne/Rng family ribonuclease [Bacillus songklensis]|uniref:Rne/Rng family ribonuclease n=1 Tax=Bacillus songklensis TaxID=1069116 RepID=A0ABV8AYL9_9BACI
MKTCYVNAASSAKRIALVGENGLERLYLEEQSKGHQIAGNIYAGRVVKVLPGMQAAFVDIGMDKNGYLHRNDLASFHLSASASKDKESITKFVREGEEILVQVVKEGIGTKGPKLTGIIEFGGECVVYLPHGNYVAVSKKITDEEREKWRTFASLHRQEQEGILLRTSVSRTSEEEVIREWQSLRERYEQVAKKKGQVKTPSVLYEPYDFIFSTLEDLFRKIDQCDVYIDDYDTYEQFKNKQMNVNGTIMYYRHRENIFRHYHIEPEIEKLLKKIVWLKNGAYIIIDQTEAMTVIDVNTGKFSGKTTQRETVLQTNIEAAKEIANQLKLRNIGGMILIDFINMKEEGDRQRVQEVLQEKVKNDDTRTTIIGFTQLGILQVTRKKVKESIEAALTHHCPICSGTGRIYSPEAVAYKIERELWEHRMMEEEAMWIETTPVVITALKRDGFLPKLEDMIGFKVFLTDSPHLHGSYSIRHIGSIKTIQERIQNAK